MVNSSLTTNIPTNFNLFLVMQTEVSLTKMEWKKKGREEKDMDMKGEGGRGGGN